MAAPGDLKSALNQAAQKYCKRPITKQDLVYSVQRFGTGPTAQYQATVTLGFLDGQQYAGEVAASDKLASHHAAQQALLALEPLIAEMAPSAPGKKNNNKRKASAAGLPPGMPAMMEQFAEFMGLAGADPEASIAATPAQPAQPASVTPKVELNTLCMRLCRRPLQKGETVYTTSQAAGGYQGTVALPCLPGEWAEKTWAGEVAATKPLAEQNAAAQALADLREDPELASKASVPAASKKGKGKGKDKGKDSWGKGYDWSGGYGVIPGGWNKGFGKGKWGKDAGFKGKGKGYDPRETVTEIALTGEVVNWNGQFGFLQAHAPIDHPNAEMRGGKIYCCQKDLAAGIESPQIEQGQVVQFQVYANSQGLGATEVMPF